MWLKPVSGRFLLTPKLYISPAGKASKDLSNEPKYDGVLLIVLWQNEWHFSDREQRQTYETKPQHTSIKSINFALCLLFAFQDITCLFSSLLPFFLSHYHQYPLPCGLCFSRHCLGSMEQNVVDAVRAVTDPEKAFRIPVEFWLRIVDQHLSVGVFGLITCKSKMTFVYTIFLILAIR